MYSSLTVDQFETGRISKILSGFLIVIDYLKTKYKQHKAVQKLDFYVKDHGDVERLMKRNLDNLTTELLFYVRN